MMIKFMNFSYKELPAGQWLCISFAVITGMLLAVILSDFLYIDDLRIPLAPMNKIVGRPFFDLLFYVLSGPVILNSAPFVQLLSIFLLSVSALCSLIMFKLRVNFITALLTSVIVSRFGMLEVMSYKLDSIMQIFAVSLSVFAVFTLSSRVNVFRVILSSFLCTSAVFLYQVGLLFYVVCCLLLLVWSDHFSLKRCGIYIFPLATSAALYGVYVKYFADLSPYVVSLGRIMEINVFSLVDRLKNVYNMHAEYNSEFLFLFLFLVAANLIIEFFSANSRADLLNVFIYRFPIYILLVILPYCGTIFLAHEWASLTPRSSYLYPLVAFIFICRIVSFFELSHVRFLLICCACLVFLRIGFLTNFYGNMLSSQGKYVDSILWDVASDVNAASASTSIKKLIILNGIGYSPIVRYYLPTHSWLAKLVPVHIGPNWYWSNQEIRHFGFKVVQELDGIVIDKARVKLDMSKIFSENVRYKVMYTDDVIFLKFKE